MEIEDEIYQALIESWGGKATPEQKARVREWLEESASHRDSYDRLHRLWCKVCYAEKYGKVDVERAKEEFLRHVAMEKRGRGRFYRFVAWGGSVAACLLVAWFVAQKPVDEEQTELFEISEIVGGQADVTLVLGDGRQVAIRRDSAFNLNMGKVNLEQAAGTGLRYSTRNDSAQGAVPAQVEYNVIKVPRGGEYTLTLEDGTRIWLNSETELKFPVRFVGKTREVKIVGEGYFEVAKDSLRPFVVRAGDVRTQVLGTSFNVKAYRDEKVRAVTLVSGKVSVSAGRERELLSPGWQAAWDEERGALSKQKVDVKPIVSWKTGMFDFVDMPLEELTTQLSRWYDVDFFFVNESIKNIHFTGAVKRANTLKFMLDFVSLTSDVGYEIKGKTICLYSVK